MLMVISNRVHSVLMVIPLTDNGNFAALMVISFTDNGNFAMLIVRVMY